MRAHKQKLLFSGNQELCQQWHLNDEQKDAEKMLKLFFLTL